jgi:aryl-alcohol dehydrogenase-like predicted oxidoreductase
LAEGQHLEVNIAALDIELSAEDLAHIDAVAPKGAASGSCYPEGALQFVNG